MIIFCFSHAGGFASHYNFLKDLEYYGHCVVLYEYAGRGKKFVQPLYISFTQAAKEIAAVINEYDGDQKIALLGHSMGGYVAYEAAYYLETLYQRIVEVVIVSGIPAPDHFSAQKVHKLNDEEIKQHITYDTDKTIPAALYDQMIGLLLPAIRNDFRILEEHFPINDVSSIQAKIISFFGKNDETASAASIEAWSAYTANYGGSITFEGGHFFPFDKRKEYTQCILKILEVL